MYASIPLSQLVPNRDNPRRTKPERDAHRRMVATLRAHDLLEPLIVRPMEDSDKYLVIAGNRRLAGLREVFKGKDPKIACNVRKTGDPHAIALAENFAQEPMHPLDEAEAFARLIREEDKDVATVVVDFGVEPGYVRQRMKLAGLADPIKAAYRANRIDTGTAEAFAAIPDFKQLEIWKDLKGEPRNAEHVRSIIDNEWIDAKHALFDVDSLPMGTVSRDLFGERVLVSRRIFFPRQQQALEAKQKALVEEGWKDVVVGDHSQLQEQRFRMDEATGEYDEQVSKKLAKLEEKRSALETKLNEIDHEDQTVIEELREKLEALDTQAEELTNDAPVTYPESVKATATAFLILDPDGQVRHEYRVPRPSRSQHAESNGEGQSTSSVTPPTPDDLSDRQKATLYTVQALAVRHSLLGSTMARKRLLALILHEKVHSDALAIRHGSNETNAHIQQTQSFASPSMDALSKLRAEVDPFAGQSFVTDHEAYERLQTLTEAQLDALIEVLTVEALTAHLDKPAPVVGILARELAIDLRKEWRPDAEWLGSYQKLQLADLLGSLLGPAHGGAARDKKKSELVEVIAGLFASAAAGELPDTEISKRLNEWLPAEMRIAPVPEANIATEAAVGDPEETPSTHSPKSSRNKKKPRRKIKKH